MAYEYKPGEITLFPNDKRQTDKHPNLKGQGKLLDGTEVWASAWVNINPSDGSKRISIKLEEKQKPAQQRQEPHALSTDFGEPSNQLDDEIPF